MENNEEKMYLFSNINLLNNHFKIKAFEQNFIKPNSFELLSLSGAIY